MKTLKQVLNVRKIDCQVETDVASYRGDAKNLLKEISQRELNLHVLECVALGFFAFWGRGCSSAKSAINKNIRGIYV